ncbi:MAG: toll/interleukin-1 receptor domain-containing protein [Chloroflexi bacterium]|nr:toll/interleukin-1 receptor domain-containing protein [Chloroflexota bacterium]
MYEPVHEDADALEGGEIEAYCVRDRQRVVMLNPTPVWTGRGRPAMRGDCPICGGSVFRLGKTPAHDQLARPSAIHVAEPKSKRAKLAPDSVYIAYEAEDSEFAMQLASDLERMGMPHWLHDPEPQRVQWAGGVHPALKECGRMVLVASPATLHADNLSTAWQFFRQKSKPIFIAQLLGVDPPDALRRAPRFDFDANYKLAFRGLLAALNE